MTKLLKPFILSAVLAAAVWAAPLPVEDDPCAFLATLNASSTNVHHVTDCYKSIEYNAEEANATLNVMHTLYNDFFIFRDSALSPHTTPPFSTRAVDVIAGLEMIRKTPYKIDYEFHSDISLLIKSLDDAHSAYGPDCYNSFVFQQPLILYAPVVNGSQSVRILRDLGDFGLTDCKVLTIDNKDAQGVIQSWADHYMGFSKDPGVRFNAALGSSEYSSESQTWSIGYGMFASRTFPPTSDSLHYELECPNQDKNINLRANWTVTFPSSGTFSDKKSYVDNICRSKPKITSDLPSINRNVIWGSEFGLFHTTPLTESRILTEYRREIMKREVQERRSLAKREENGTIPDDRDLLDATYLGGNKTAAYHLKSKPNVGVLTLSTMDVDLEAEVNEILAHLDKFAELNVTNIVIDTVDNPGGLVYFAYYLTTVFFPTLDNKDNSQSVRAKITSPILALSDADAKNENVTSNYDPSAYVNKTTDKPFETSPFHQPVTLDINGRKAEYTDKMYFKFDPTLLKLNKTYSWTGDGSKITILTDGRCGSACGMASDLFVKHGVKAVAVGGHSGRDLSMFSFAGASVIKLSQILEWSEKLNVTTTLSPLSYGGEVTIGVIEAYSHDDTTPLEYNPGRHSAAYRLDYTPETMRNRDKLWGAVSETVWTN